MPNATIMCWPSGIIESYKGLSCGQLVSNGNGITTTSLDTLFAAESGTKGGRFKALIPPRQAIRTKPHFCDAQWLDNYEFIEPPRQEAKKGIDVRLWATLSQTEQLYVSILGTRWVNLYGKARLITSKIVTMRGLFDRIFKRNDEYPIEVIHYLIAMPKGGKFTVYGGFKSSSFDMRPLAWHYSWDGKTLAARDKSISDLEYKLRRNMPDHTGILNFLNGHYTIVDELTF